MKKMRNDNKGFTLVEMIVVLVILAILAAILVPALLGYIDEAKNSQLELHGKSVYTAAQAVASKAYGKTNGNDIQTANGAALTDFISQVRTISEMETFGKTATDVKVTIWFKGNTLTGTNGAALSTTEKHNYYTINEMTYSEDGGTTYVRLYNGAWETGESGKFNTASDTTNSKGSISFAAKDSTQNNSNP
ncbi:MAG: type II secretion system protein [Lachnospiraceae bacterium]|nr:type II secretion system protein [Lachnospiraceae bacterium]